MLGEQLTAQERSQGCCTLASMQRHARIIQRWAGMICGRKDWASLQLVIGFIKYAKLWGGEQGYWPSGHLHLHLAFSAQFMEDWIHGRDTEGRRE